MSRSPSPAPRTIDVILPGGSEQISIDLDNLPFEEEGFEDILSCLNDAQGRVIEFTQIAQEYWRTGNYEFAKGVADLAVKKFTEQHRQSDLPPMHYLLANINLTHARHAPKMILPPDEVQQDKLASDATKKTYLNEAARHLNSIPPGDSTDFLGFLTRGLHQLANRHLDDAYATFEGILSHSPRNVVALIAKARIQYSRRQFREALRTLQQVLQLKPDCQPDPRVGIGLCFWALGEKEKARMAWERSLEVNPSNNSATLLLGLHAMNQSKEAGDDVSQQTRTNDFSRGAKLLSSVLRAEPYTGVGAAAANAVSEIMHRQGGFQKALKIAERAIQFADTLPVVSDSYLRAARACHDLGYDDLARKHYAAAAENSPTKVLAWIGKAQMHVLADEIPAAIHTLDTILASRPECLEATILLASLCAHPRPALSASDATAERKKARELYDRLTRIFSSSRSKAIHNLAEDKDMHCDIARLWQNENLERAGKAYKEAARISLAMSQSANATGVVDPRLLNNLGVLRHLDGDFEMARDYYQEALTNASTLAAEDESMDGVLTSTMYNLARVYEQLGEENSAKEAYDKLLAKHPEYLDAKIGRARMLVSQNRHDEAHRFIKEALETQSDNFNTRAFYTWFFYNCGRLKEGCDFTSASLKMNSNDVYNLCAYGWFLHNTAREGRSKGEEANAERLKTFTRAATSYINALTQDPACAVAAQGLAMIVAEDLLGSWAPGARVNEMKSRGNAREALTAFAKVKESLTDGSVYVNMGHCYFVREEHEKAIESYETALHRYGGSDVSVLLYLTRSWYAKANKDKSFQAMGTALRYCQDAYEKAKDDKSILYNIAMIEQKSLEMLFSVEDLSKRTLEDLEQAVEHAKHAQTLFNALASDESKMLPYNRDIADQRRKYGETMLRKGEDHINRQREYELENKSRMDEARRLRQEENDRIAAKKAAELEAKRQQEEALREARRIARETAAQWTAAYRNDTSSDEEKKPKRKAGTKKVKSEGGPSGDETGGGEVKREKPKKRLKKKKFADEDGDEAMMPAEVSAGEDGQPRPKKPRAKKRVVQDDEEDNDETVKKRRKTLIKSKEIISDSDEE
ncbi:hypothetical protein FRC03_009248 [Tulasnella sp. 419]|nr:hypothetical protein FRC02_008019 [Tulasnella sp. 418]KAG8967845.1 hypothetical protein FRC03_009248 [Tulasnella sp. 419]